MSFRNARQVRSGPPARGAGVAAVVACVAMLGVPGCGGAPASGPIETTAIFGEVGLSPGQFSYPRAMDADSRSLWVIDKQARVQRLDVKTGLQLGEWQMPKWELGKPTGITVWDPTGRDEDALVFVADTHYHRVAVYRPSAARPGGGVAEAIAEFGGFGTEPGRFIYTTDVAILPSADGRRIEKVYVSEYGGNDRVSVFRAPEVVGQGEFVHEFSFGGFGTDGGPEVRFNRPQSLWLDARGRRLYIADACNHRIGVFTLDGKLEQWFGGPESVGTQPGSFKYPYGITGLGDGTAVVVEFGNSRVQRIDLTTGASLGVYGGLGRREGLLTSPWSSARVGETLFVLDSGNNRVVGMRSPAGRLVDGGGKRKEGPG